MNRFKYISIIAIAIIAVMTYTCRKTPCDRLQLQIKNALKDDKFTNKEFESLSEFASKHNLELFKCYSGFKDSDGLKNSLTEIIKNHPSYSKEITLEFAENQDIDLTAKLYLETSYSMYGYDHPKIGDFKTTLTSLLGSFPEDKRALYIVNDTVYEPNITYNELTHNNNILKETKGVGKASHTDFNKIFEKIFRDLKDNETAILFSDLIISQQFEKQSNEAKINDSKSMIRDIFIKYADHYSTLVLKFNGQFLGTYYAYNNTNIKNYHGKRPFYVTVIAKNETMNKFLLNDRYKIITDWSKYRNFEDLQYFNKISKPSTPKYSIQIDKNNMIGSYKRDRTELKQSSDEIHSLQNVKSTADGLELKIDVDFSNLPLSQEILLDTNNYTISNDFKIQKITPLPKEHVYTHQINIRYIKENFDRDRNISISLKKNASIAQWISDSNTNDDTDINAENFPKTTFGLIGLMSGIQEAYQSTNETYYLFNLTLKK